MAAVVKPWVLKLWKLSWGTVQIRVAPTSILPHQGGGRRDTAIALRGIYHFAQHTGASLDPLSFDLLKRADFSITFYRDTN